MMNNRIRKTLPIIFVIMMLLVGCSCEQYTDEQGNISDLIGGRFVVVDEYKDTGTEGNYYGTYVVYDKDTKIMYYILDGFRRAGLCPMYDEHGNVMIYGGEIDAK